MQKERKAMTKTNRKKQKPEWQTPSNQRNNTPNLLIFFIRDVQAWNEILGTHQEMTKLEAIVTHQTPQSSLTPDKWHQPLQPKISQCHTLYEKVNT